MGCGWAVAERTNIAHAAVTVPDWGQSVSRPPPRSRACPADCGACVAEVYDRTADTVTVDEIERIVI